MLLESFSKGSRGFPCVLIIACKVPTLEPVDDLAFWLIGGMPKAYVVMNCLESLSLLSSVTSSLTHILSPKKFLLYMWWHYHTNLHPQKFIFACNRNLSFSLQLAHLKTSGCAEFGHLTAKESDFSSWTRLIHSDDDDTHKIPGFEVLCRNDQLWDQTTRPPHGLLSYVRDIFSDIRPQNTNISEL